MKDSDYKNKGMKLIRLTSMAALLLLMVGLMVSSAGSQPVRADNEGNTDTASDGCMQDVAGFGLNCTANDIQIAGVALDEFGDPKITIIDDGCAFPGDTVTFTADFEVLLTAQARHDIGMWFATDGDPNGDGAYTGQCTAGTPAYAPDPPWLDLDAAPGTCTLRSTLGCDANSDCAGGGGTKCNPDPDDPDATVNTCSNDRTATCSTVADCNFGTCDLNAPLSGDTCGDIDSAHNPLFPSMTITAQCIAGPDGNLSLPNCTSWRQPGANDLCTSPLNAYPGAPSKCNCDKGFTVPIRVPGFITVDKVTIDANGDPLPGDPTLFGFSITGPTFGPNNAYLPDNFSLKDADAIHTSPPLDTTDEDNNVVGPYQITESTPPAGWELESASCTRDYGTPNDTSDDTTFLYTNGGDIQPLPGEVVACAFTNMLVKVAPKINTVATGLVYVGEDIQDTANLSAGNNPTGTITFNLYGPDDATCSADSIFESIVDVDSGNGTYNSGTFTTTEVGSYYWTASYSGDDLNEPVESSCNEPFEVSVVTQRSPSITTLASWTGETVGNEGTVGDSATFVDAYNPTGQIDFTLYSDAACTVEVLSGSGVIVAGEASYSQLWTPTAAGTYYWIADYAGDTNNEGFTTSCGDDNEDITVDPRSPSITTLASWTGETVGNEGTVGDSATFVDAYNPTGQIDFTLYSDAACTVEVLSGSGVIVAGEASYSQLWTPTAAGTYYWIADYAGDTNNEGFTTSCGDDNEDITVDPRSPSITTLASWTGETVGNEGTVGDSATFVDAYNPTGQIDFTLYSDAACTVEVLSGSGVIVAGEASYSQLWTPTAAGTYYWIADYAGDTNNEGFTTSCGDDNEDITVDPRSPSITTLASWTGETVGNEGTVGDSATFVDAYNPTGQIDFTLYSDAACTVEVLSGSGVIVAGEASYSQLWTPTAAGTYYWIADYAGDTNNEGFTTSCGDDNEDITVDPRSPSITTLASWTGETVGNEGTVGDSATFVDAYNPTGQIDFTLYSDAACTVEVLSGSGVIVAGEASYSQLWTPTAAGTYYWIADYAGDTNNEGFTTSCGDDNEDITVDPRSPSITTLASWTGETVGNEGTVGDSATFVDAYNPTGQIDFTLYSDAACTVEVLSGSGVIVAGEASYSQLWTPTAAGTYYWIADYAGDTNNEGFTTSCGDDNEDITVDPRSPSITTLASWTGETVGNEGTVGDSATFVDAYNPTGQIDFTLYSDAACTVEVLSGSGVIVAGEASYSQLWTPTAAGTYYWIADYAGDTNNEGFTTSCGDDNEDITVDPRSPSITTLASWTGETVGNEGTVGDSATFVDAYNPTGQIDFTLYSDAACTVEVLSGSGVIVAGEASYSQLWTPTAAGTYYWIADYAGDTNNEGFTTSCGDDNEDITVDPRSPSITTLASWTGETVGNEGTVGDSATFVDAYNPTGQIDFTLYSDAACTVEVLSGSGVIVAGEASYSQLWTPTAAGTYYWIADYAGDTNNEGFTTSCGDDNEDITVDPRSPSITTLASWTGETVGNEGTVGDSATFVDAYNPTGQIDFTLYSDAACTVEVLSGSGVIVAGEASYSQLWTPTAAGTYYWIADYAGDTNNEGFTTSCGDDNEDITVDPRSPSITTLASWTGETVGNEGTVGDSATFVDAYNPTGQIDFTLYSDAACTVEVLSGSGVIVAGEASYSQLWTPTAAGTYYWIADYAGDTNNEGFTTSCGDDNEDITVDPRSPSITTLASWTGETVGNEGTVGDSATFVDAYNPTGQIDFTLYSDAACTVEVLSGSGVIVAGEASYSQLWTPTAAGTYYWIADYAGDTNNEGFTTSCGDDNEDITVDPRSPSITTLASWTGETVGNEGTVGDSATFVDAYNPTGQIDFTLYSDAACTVEVLSGSGVIVAGEASYSQLWTPTAAGTYYWIADYAGDTNNEGFTTSCGDDNEDITVDPRSPSITTLADPTNAVLGQEINVGDTATLHDAYNPTGQIDFTLYSDAACTEEVLSGSGDISGSTASYFTNWTFNQFGTYYWIAHYDGDINNESFTTSCGDANEMLTVAPPIAVTDSALCDFGGTFRNIFSMDPKLVPWYKDTATNPGQFYYNLSVTGTPGEVVPVTLSIPWPFVTQGARPVHVYDGVAYDTSTGVFCFDPDEFNELAAIDNYIVLSDYGVAANTSGYLNGVSEQYVEVELLITIPDTGFAYINQHMDYGLKGLDTDFDGDGTADPQHYVKDANDDALLPDYATPSSAVYPPVVLIPEMAEHPFCTYMGEGHDPDLLGCDTAYKDNDWKFNPGISGMVLEVFWNTTDGVTYEEGIEGAKVELLDRKGNLVGTDYSDEDGWYQIVYKHIGRPSDYTFRATLNGTIFERVVKLSGNEFEEVNVYLDSTNGAAADYAHIGEMSGSAKYLNKNWNATVSIQVVDQDGVSIANAQVSGNWDFGDPGLCITDLTGWCTVSVTKLDNSLPSVTFSVLDVAAEGYLYDPAANFNDPAEFTVDGP